MPSRPPPKVLAIQHISAEPLGTLEHALVDAGITVESVRVDRGEPVPLTAAGFDGLVVMGGSMGVYEADRFPFLKAELQLLEDALRRDLPILGICLGAQLLAAASGSRVFPSGRQEIGWYPLHLRPEASSDTLLAGLPSTFQAFHWHGDTFELPAGSMRLGSSDLTVEQGFRVGRAAYGLQFHLEVNRAVISAMVAGADRELTAAGVAARGLPDGCDRHVGALEAIARIVFGRWAGLVTAAAPVGG